MRCAAILTLALVATVAQAQECTEAGACDPAACVAPDCACSGGNPDNIALEERPQIVYLTFDDAITALAADQYYSGIFDGTYTNPNGCPIRGTHFLTHQSTDYSLAHDYYVQGHEMAVHSITHRSNTTYWAIMDEDTWVSEIIGMRDMVVNYARIPVEAIKGMRSPFLQGGGNTQFKMMQDYDLLYDSTYVSREFGYTNMANGIWPYTLDYKSTQDCQIEPCPTCSYPGIWEQPILDLEDAWFNVIPDNPDQGQPCGMLDSCIINDPVPGQVYNMLMKNFLRAYEGNTRAPFGLYMHAAWFFGQDWHYEGYKMFLDNITSSYYDDVWVVPIIKGLEYRQSPVTNQQLLDNGQSGVFGCDTVFEPACSNSHLCQYEDVHNEDLDLFSITMTICCEDGGGDCCPPEYPWLNNPTGAAPTEAPPKVH